MLDPEARKELRTLSRETADLVARHLVATGQLLDDDPSQALAHARAARALAGRIGIVREAAGLAAYAAGEWAEALSELRAARRITGEPAHVAVTADCERALGRPDRALAYGDDTDVPGLPQEQRVELIIVMAGARRDLGQQDAAVLVLQEPARRTTDKRPWAARLWYAYADALLAAGRETEAQEWFARTAAVDVEGQTDAGDRLLLLEGVVLDDPGSELSDDDERDDLPTAEQLAELVRDLPALESANSPSGAGSADEAARPTPGGARAPGSGVAADGPAPLSARPAVAQPLARLPQKPTSEPAPAEQPLEPAPRRKVAAPTFVAPPSSTDDEDLRLFD